MPLPSRGSAASPPWRPSSAGSSRLGAGEDLAATGLDVERGGGRRELLAEEPLVAPRRALLGGAAVEPGEVPAVDRDRRRLVHELVERPHHGEHQTKCSDAPVGRLLKRCVPIPEAARLLRPGGKLVFLGNSSLLMLCAPDDDDVPASDRTAPRPLGIYRFDWPGDPTVESSISGTAIGSGCCAANDFVIEELIELRPSAGKPISYDFVTAEWARRWPAEEAWRVPSGVKDSAVDEPKRVVRDGYDRIARDYERWGEHFGVRQKYLAQVRAAVPIGERVVDLGCGTGRHATAPLAESYRVVGVDISPVSASLASRPSLQRSSSSAP